MTTEQIMLSLLRSEVCKAELPKNLIEELAPEVLSELYSLSKYHDLAHLVGASLEKLGVLDNEIPICAKFQKQMFLSVYRYEKLNYELDEVCRTLRGARIAHIPLKGSVLRAYYPEPWMRTSCDIDILVNADELQNAMNALVLNLGYRVEETGNHDVSMFSSSGVHIELHFELNEPDFRIFECLTRVWELVYEDSSSPYTYIMPDELFYFYHVAHMAKHVLNGGCGIRSFLDLWILTHCIDFDVEKRKTLLKEGLLLDFEQEAHKLSEVWFSDAEREPFTYYLEEYILHGGVYGSKENLIVIQKTKKGSSFKYLLTRVFLSYDQLRQIYPVLEKHRALTPICQIRRWFGLVFSKRIKRVAREIKTANSVKSDKEAAMQLMFEHLGIDQ